MVVATVLGHPPGPVVILGTKGYPAQHRIDDHNLTVNHKFWGTLKGTRLQAGPPRGYHYLATFFQYISYNKRRLRPKTGGACLYMPQDGHRLQARRPKKSFLFGHLFFNI